MRSCGGERGVACGTDGCVGVSGWEVMRWVRKLQLVTQKRLASRGFDLSSCEVLCIGVVRVSPR